YFSTVDTGGRDGGSFPTRRSSDLAGTGASQATWTFAASPGRYRVWATWVPFANRATNALYTVLDSATALATVSVNQEQAPADFSDEIGRASCRGGVYILSGALVVRLSDQANELVIADAI